VTGWRLLEVGEVIAEGDEIDMGGLRCAADRWERVNRHLVGDTLDSDTPIRRRMPSGAPVAGDAVSDDAKEEASGEWVLLDPAGNERARESSCIHAWARIDGYKPTVEGLLGYQEAGWRVIPVALDEESFVREKLAKLLAETIVALRGPEPPLTRWSLHDIPERVAALVAERDALREANNSAAVCKAHVAEFTADGCLVCLREKAERENAALRARLRALSLDLKAAKGEPMTYMEVAEQRSTGGGEAGHDK